MRTQRKRPWGAILGRQQRVRRGFPMLRPVAARLPRLLRSLAMTNLAALPSHVIARSEATRQSQVGSNEFAGGFPAIPAGCCEIATAPAEPRNDKLGSASLPCHCEEGASPTRQSQVGTFDFAGAFPCSGRYCEIAAPCSARLAMTNLGAFPIRRGAAPSLRVPPSRVIPRSEATWESHAGTCGFARVRLSPPLRQYIA